VRLECGSEAVPHPKGLKRNGRHEETRTPDLYRVNSSKSTTYNDIAGHVRHPESLLVHNIQCHGVPRVCTTTTAQSAELMA